MLKASLRSVEAKSPGRPPASPTKNDAALSGYDAFVYNRINDGDSPLTYANAIVAEYAF